jgi:hypothetical protein
VILKTAEIANYYRRVQGKPVKICLPHEAHMCKQHIGKPLDLSHLSAHIIQCLEGKDDEFEFECPNCSFKTVVSQDVLDDGVPYAQHAKSGCFKSECSQHPCNIGGNMGPSTRKLDLMKYSLTIVGLTS